MNDIRRTILWVIFGFAMVLLWDQWQVYNGNKATFFPTPAKPGAMLYVSPQVESILGFAPREWMAEPAAWIQHGHPDDRGSIHEEYRRADETRGSGSGSERRTCQRRPRARTMPPATA